MRIRQRDCTYPMRGTQREDTTISLYYLAISPHFRYPIFRFTLCPLYYPANYPAFPYNIRLPTVSPIPILYPLTTPVLLVNLRYNPITILISTLLSL